MRPIGWIRDRISHQLTRWGITVARCGKGEYWLLGGCHVVRRYRYTKVVLYLWKRSVQYERSS